MLTRPMQGVPEGLEFSDLHSSFQSWEGAEGLILTLLQFTGPPLLVRGAGGWVPCSGTLAVSTWKWREGAEGPGLGGNHKSQGLGHWWVRRGSAQSRGSFWEFVDKWVLTLQACKVGPGQLSLWGAAGGGVGH